MNKSNDFRGSITETVKTWSLPLPKTNRDVSHPWGELLYLPLTPP